MKSYNVTMTYRETKYTPCNVYKVCVAADDGMAARRNAIFLAHADGCKNVRVTNVRAAN